MKTYSWHFIVFVLLILCASPLYSQNKETIDDYYIDFAVPDLGAFTLLNMKPENISTPGNTKEFAASLLNVVSGGSTISPGLAIDWSPLKTFWKQAVNQQEYKNTYLLRNLQITLGTIADSIGTKVGVGLKWTFIDQTDPLLDDKFEDLLIKIHKKEFEKLNEGMIPLFHAEVDDFLQNIFEKRKINPSSTFEDYLYGLFDEDDTILTKRDIMLNYKIARDTIQQILLDLTHNTLDSLTLPELERLQDIYIQLKNITNYSERYNNEVSADIENAKKQWLENHWNATVVTFGAGWVGNSTDRKWNTLNTQILKTYLNGKFKVSKNAQLVGLLSYGRPHNVTNTDSTITSQWFLGGRFLIGDAEKRFSVDLGYNYDIAKLSSYNSRTLIANVGVEFKVSDGVFLEIAGGFNGKPSTIFKSSNILALGSLKYALHPKSRYSFK